jgi:hypothetical protein
MCRRRADVGDALALPTPTPEDSEFMAEGTSYFSALEYATDLVTLPSRREDLR